RDDRLGSHHWHTCVRYHVQLASLPMAELLRPDVLVLAAGGVVGEAWMTGVLAGIEAETDIDFRRVEAFVGTSAGSIVAASLAAGRSPRRPGRGGGPTRAEAAFGERRAEERSGGLAAVAVRTAARMGGAVTAP